MRFLSLASIGNRSWVAPLASLINGLPTDMVGLALPSIWPVFSSLFLPIRISMIFPSVLSGSSLMSPLSASSGDARTLSTIFCILLFGWSMVGKKSLYDAMWWLTILRSRK